ncbi:MAG: helix-turn-helix domain-containing protein [Bacteroidales bacterium]
MDVSKTLYVKYMVCKCCIRILRQELEQHGIRIYRIILGEIDISYDSSKISEEQIEKIINNNGFELVANKDKILVEQIKTAVIELVHIANNMNSIIRNSDYLVEKLGYSYQHLSAIFSKYEPHTLEKFVILHKIEKVKEMIEYGDLTLSEIAFTMGYSSVQYLSTQFKNITGISVTDYKKAPDVERKSIAEI